jgi:hypothetical protein
MQLVATTCDKLFFFHIIENEKTGIVSMAVTLVNILGQNARTVYPQSRRENDHSDVLGAVI